MNQIQHPIQPVGINKESSIVVPKGDHIYNFSTHKIPQRVLTMIDPVPKKDEKEPKDKVQSKDTVEVNLHPRGFYLIVKVEGDSAKVTFTVEA
jgi:hypothetical protein